MISPDVVETINDVRFHFTQARRLLDEQPSFRSLEASSESLRGVMARWDEVLASPRLAQICDGKLTCAIVGSSGHGKTTLLDEMFPGLAGRGWLVTDVTDTTSQALRIAYADPEDPASTSVRVRSWDVPRLKELVGHEEVRRQHAADGIHVSWHEDAVVVDGREAAWSQQEKANFRFPLEIPLTAFPKPFEVPRNKLEDRAFIRALTIKEPSELLTPGPLLEVGGASFDALQLRAVVKDVALGDPFERLEDWAGEHREDVRSLVFVDTPGLATAGSVKDEVLRHVLERKSAQIVLDMWQNDELDLVVHLVLNGRQSDFASLWKELERVGGPAEVEGLSERLVLAVNGANVWFTNRDVKAKHEDPETWKREGDHFATTLEDNVLQKMSPRGRFRPAEVVFLDSRSIVETMTAGPYARAYGEWREKMAGWVEPGGPGHDTLERLGLLEGFRENAEALADPEDRGQGLLVRRLLTLAKRKGPALLARKHLVRSGLLDALVEIRETLGRFYDDEGGMNQEGVRTAIRSCLGFLGERSEGLEDFAAHRLDPHLREIARSDGAGETEWPRRAFQELHGLVKEAILSEAGASPQAEAAFSSHFDAMGPLWAERWGWEEARLTAPERNYGNSKALAVHTLGLHAREMLFELGREEARGGVAFEQSPEDRARVREVLQMLDEALHAGRELVRDLGVSS